MAISGMTNQLFLMNRGIAPDRVPSLSGNSRIPNLPSQLNLQPVVVPHMPSLDLKLLGSKKAPVNLITLHGGPGLDSSYFLPFLAPLQQVAGLAFYTQGSSGKDTIEGLLEEMDEVLSMFRGKRVFILAHSFGAALLLEYIRRRMECSFAGIILSSWIYDAAWIQRYNARFPEDDTEGNGTCLTDDDFRIQTVSIVGRYFMPRFAETGRRVLSGIKYNAKLYMSIWNSFLQNFNGGEVVSNLERPSLSITGSGDLITDVDYVRRGVSLNPNMERVEIKDVGHFPFVEKGRIFNKAVRDFILKNNQQHGRER